MSKALIQLALDEAATEAAAEDQDDLPFNELKPTDQTGGDAEVTDD